ncbi:restriction endonuclease subunit S [Streptomyces sp. NPDC048389]|uniref:restriction endonuclease subunit S n=1 Tax=Streptomyces sp. NPDC048389 TaxID=3154622 RepID=UPI003452A9AA
MVRYLRAANVKDGTLDLADVQSMNFTPAEQNVFALRAGDVLVSEGSGSLSSVGASAVWRGELEGIVCFQNTLLRLRPRVGVDGRYLEWWARSAFGSGVFASISSGANIYHLSAERVRALPISLPPLEEQRRIADFLDAETARIGGLDASRSAQLRLLSDRERAMLDHSFGEARSGVPTRLKYLFSVRPRYGVLVPVFTDDGVPFIRVNDLLDLEGRADGLRNIPSELSAQYTRSVVRPGDLLMSVVGTLGRTAIAPASLTGANIARAVCSMRFMPDVEVQLVEAWIGSSSFNEQALIATSTDTAQPTLGMEDLGNFSLTWPSDPQERRHMIREIDRIQSSMRSLSKKLERQKAVLTERRQALITAAVTGQIDVSTASGRGIEE